MSKQLYKDADGVYYKMSGDIVPEGLKPVTSDTTPQEAKKSRKSVKKTAKKDVKDDSEKTSSTVE